jgi:glucokinase
MQILCLDIGAASIKYGRMDERAAFVTRGEIPSRAREGAEKVFSRLCELIRPHLPAISCISLCTKGRIDEETGRILFATEDIPGWTDFPLVPRLKAAFGLPVFAVNDVLALALGEAHFGSMCGGRSFLCINFGSGIGGVAVAEGRPVLSAPGRLPEMGHILLHPDGRRCACGRQGCYEAYASVHALTRLAASKLRRRMITGRELFSLMERGDPIALSCLDAWVREVALGLASLLSVLNPRCLVLGGGVMQRPLVVERVRLALSSALLPSLMPDEIRAAALGNAAGLYGCFVVARQNLEALHAFPE